jgi:hypothetical protein
MGSQTDLSPASGTAQLADLIIQTIAFTEDDIRLEDAELLQELCWI